MKRFLSALVVFGACKSEEVDFVVEPAEGSMAGYYTLSVETELQPTEVWVGDNRAYDVVSDGSTLQFTTVGAPEPGPVDVVLVGDGERQRIAEGFEFLPAAPGFETYVAVGASLSQGVQGGVPTQHGQIHSPPRFIARQAGAYFPLPLLKKGLFPPITGAEVTGAPDCDAPGVADHLTSAAIDVLVKLNDEENNRIGFYMGLVDPELAPQNLAVGNSGVPTILHGPDPEDFAQQFLSKLVFDLDGDIADETPGSQLQIIEAMDPTVIVCADTYGNDLLKWKPVAEIQSDLELLVQRMADTGAEVFLSNIPRPTLLPGSRGNAERDELGAEYIAALDAEAAKYPNVHVVDLATEVELLAVNGLDVGQTHLTTDVYNGLISTDGLHLSDVGYAYQSNLFIAKINDVMGTDIPLVDLVPVLENDEHAPHALLDQGLDPACLPAG